MSLFCIKSTKQATYSFQYSLSSLLLLNIRQWCCYLTSTASHHVSDEGTKQPGQYIIILRRSVQAGPWAGELSFMNLSTVSNVYTHIRTAVHTHTHSCGGTAAVKLKVMWPSQILLPVISIKTYAPDVDLMEKDTAGGEIKCALIPATCATCSPNYPNDINYKGAFKSVFG